MESKARELEIETVNASEVEKSREDVSPIGGNFVYDDNDEEPELHARTYFALAAMFFLNLVQVLALQGPPAVVRNKITSGFEQN
jgi:hypothetical protein